MTELKRIVKLCVFIVFWCFLLINYNKIHASPLLLIVLFYIFDIIGYYKSTYYKNTKNKHWVTKRDLGKYGEFLTYEELKKFEKNGARFLFNVYIPKNETETTEIDVLMISKWGLLVIESKNYSGWIFGKTNDKMWTQVLPSGRKSVKSRFYNPFKQNETHIKYLKGLVDEKVPLQSIIVFSNRCTFKDLTNNTDVPIIKRKQVLKTVCDLYECQPSVLNDTEIEKLYLLLLPYTLVSKDIKEKHIENIRDNYSRVFETDDKDNNHKNESDVKKESYNVDVDNIDEAKNIDSIEIEQKNNIDQGLQNDICPKCGANLVLKVAKKGQNKGNSFWGCSNFPKCRYIKSVTDDHENMINNNQLSK